MPEVEVRTYINQLFAWPSLCSLPAGVPDARGRLPPMRYSFKTSQTKQKFSVQLNSRIGADGMTRVESFMMEMA